eukprot:TRINITY_DN178_c0_g1_i2.p1 TRINITY_DN178_c0_g1~~TRINITY_DN178_c0_g1_i2.p1  ORF type:complete len:525 (+),score=87.28 TRINITY_DN178_c0_g1_i2:258-1832(+)
MTEVSVTDAAVSAMYDAEAGEFTAATITGTAGGEAVEYSISDEVGNIINDTDVFFVLLSGYMVFFMQCGFAMLSAGSIRSKNAKNIILKNLLDACFGALGFYLLGYGFAYGGDEVEGKGNSFIGWHGFALNGLPKSDWYSWFFQFAFAATATTIVSGAVAERTKFEGYLLYATVLTSFVYPVVVHWVWSTTGWASAFQSDPLFDTGAIDFAGCGVVHMVGGLAALAGAWAVGPRIGAYDAEGKPTGIQGHSASFAVLGVFILWFGWYGFNPGSALAINGVSEVVALCAINTTLSAAAGTVSTLVILMVVEYQSTGHIVWDLIGASNGSLAGLVGITAACSVAEPWGAICIGLIAGAVYPAASFFISHIAKIDDPLDAVAVHGFCGAWGLIAAAAFAHKPNIAAAYSDALAEAGHGFLLSGGNGKLLGCAIVLILAITGWVLGIMVPFFLLMKVLGLLRVDESEERAGLDISHHGGSAYETDQVKEASNGSDMALLNRINALENELRSMYRSREGEKVQAPNKMQ